MDSWVCDLLWDRGSRVAKGASLMGASEFLQIHALVPLDGDEIVIAAFIIPDKQVFGIGFGIGDIHRGKLRHVINGRMLGDLMPQIFPLQKIIYFLLVHIGLRFMRQNVPHLFPFDSIRYGFISQP